MVGFIIGIFFLAATANGSYAPPITMTEASAIEFQDVTIDDVHHGRAPPLDFGMDSTIMRLNPDKTLSPSVLGAGKVSAAVVIIGRHMNGDGMVSVLEEEELLNVRIISSQTFFARYTCDTTDNEKYVITASPFVRFATGPNFSDLVMGKDIMFDQDATSNPTSVWVVDTLGNPERCIMKTVVWPIPVKRSFRALWMNSDVVEQSDQNDQSCDHFIKRASISGFLVSHSNFGFDSLRGTNIHLDSTTTSIYWEMMKMGGAIHDYIDSADSECEDDGPQDIFVDTVWFLSAPSDPVITSQFADEFMNTSRHHAETIDAGVMLMETLVLTDVSNIFISGPQRWLNEVSPKDAFMELATILKSQFKTARDSFEHHNCAFEALVGASQAQKLILGTFLRMKQISGDTCNGKICSQKCENKEPQTLGSDTFEYESSAGSGLYDWPWGFAFAVILGTGIAVVGLGGGAN